MPGDDLTTEELRHTVERLQGEVAELRTNLQAAVEANRVLREVSRKQRKDALQALRSN